MNLSRRGFLSGLGTLIGGIALDQAIPLGRVWSFPREVKCLNAASVLPALASYRVIYYDRVALDRLKLMFRFADLSGERPCQYRGSR